MYRYANLIKQLYRGNIRPNEQQIESREYAVLKFKKTDITKQILKRMDKDTKELFESIMDLDAQLCSINAEEQFEKGFKIGMKLTIEGMQKKEEY